jgi:hypothetical protein
MSFVRNFGYDRIIAGLSTVAQDRFAASVAVKRSSPSNTDVIYKHLYRRFLRFSANMYISTIFELSPLNQKSYIRFFTEVKDHFASFSVVWEICVLSDSISHSWTSLKRYSI